METYTFKVENTKLTALTPNLAIPSGNVRSYSMHFEFDGEIWKSLTKIVSFAWSAGAVSVMLDEDDNLLIPAKVLEEKGRFSFGVWAAELKDGKVEYRASTNLLSVIVVDGAYREDSIDDENPNLSIYEQLLDKLSTHISNNSNPHRVTAGQVGAYSKAESDKLLSEKAEKVHTHPYAGAATPGGAALEAVHAASADRAGTASSAVSAVYADRAGSAGMADTAEEANHAATSDNATNAAEAAHALTADNATNAASATTATEAEHAASAKRSESAKWLAYHRLINGVPFNGTANITVYDPHISPTVMAKLTASGWYRVAVKSRANSEGGAVLFLNRRYNADNGENYVFAFAQGHMRCELNTLVCDVAKQFFTKLRYIYKDDATPCYLEVYYNAERANNCYFTLLSNDGAYQATDFAAGSVPDGYSVKEFEIPAAVETFTASDKAALDGKADAADVFDDSAFAWTDFTYSASESAGATVEASHISAASSSPITIHCTGEMLGFTATASGGSYCDLKINGLVVMHSNGDQGETTLSYTLPLTRMTEDIVIELSASDMYFSGMLRRVGKWQTELGNVDEALDAILAIQDAVIGGTET